MRHQAWCNSVANEMGFLIFFFLIKSLKFPRPCASSEIFWCRIKVERCKSQWWQWSPFTHVVWLLFWVTLHILMSVTCRAHRLFLKHERASKPLFVRTGPSLFTPMANVKCGALRLPKHGYAFLRKKCSVCAWLWITAAQNGIAPLLWPKCNHLFKLTPEAISSFLACVLCMCQLSLLGENIHYVHRFTPNAHQIKTRAAQW